MFLILLLFLFSSYRKLEDLYEVAKKWEVGQQKEKVLKARETLAKKGKRALDFIFETNKIKTINSLELRTIEEVVKGNKKMASTYLKKYIHHDNDTIRRNCIFLAGQAKDSTLLPDLLRRLKEETNPLMLSRVIYSIGLIGDTSYFDTLLKYLDHQDERVRARTMYSLRNLYTPSKIHIMLKYLNDRNFQVKYNAFLALKSDTLSRDSILKILKSSESEGEKPKILQLLIDSN